MYNSVIQSSQQFRYRIQSSTLPFFLLICFTILLNFHLKAQGNINISPSRIVFEGQKRIMELNLSNDSQDSAKYSISFMQIRMTEDGVFQTITTPDPGQNFADKNIRFFPRSVVLGPNETQVVKIQLTKSDQLQPGEYRSHLYFKSLTTQKALGEEDLKKSAGNLLNITPTFGVTIPVIIRVGESNTLLNISDVKLETTAEGTRKLDLVLNRTGNMSVYGDVSILHIAPNGKQTKIGLTKGVAVYVPNSMLRVQVELDGKSGVDLSKGKIRVLYSSQSETHPQKLAEAELVLQ